MPSKKKYTPELLAPLVESSTSFSQVIRKLGLRPSGGNHRQISGRIRQAGLDTSHFKSKAAAQVDAISHEELTEVVQRSLSVAQVLVHFGLPEQGRAHRLLSQRLDDEGFDTSHFRGSGWSRGDTAATNPTLAAIVRNRMIPDEVLFSENSPVVNSAGTKLTKRLLAKGWSYSCAICGLAEWRRAALVLHLDHINGIHNDNRLENLRFLCPNCHSQTDTYCNKKRPIRAAEPRAHYSCYTTATTRAWRNWLTQHV